MLSKDNITQYFDLPIEHCQHHSIEDNLYTDLELLEVREDPSGTPFYQHVFKPSSGFGDAFLKKWSQYYTTDIPFLKDSQRLYRKLRAFDRDDQVVDNAWITWKNIKGDDNFLEKFQYLDWEKAKWLNKSTPFLTALAFYSIISPVLNLLSPILLLIIPFMILKLMRTPITVSAYTTVLLRQLNKHGIGKIFTQFHQVSWSQRVYLVVCMGMYVYNIYQNIVSCYKFYTNTKIINTCIKKMAGYLAYTKQQITSFIFKLDGLKSYLRYKEYLVEHLNSISKLQKSLANIPTATFHPGRISSLGYTMKQFYLLYESKEIERAMMFSFGFHGYINTLMGLSSNLTSKKMYPTRYAKSDDPVLELTDAHYPPTGEESVPNDISLGKSKIITGPNAAGKTTILKTTLTNLLLSQQIGYGFFRKARITPFHYIHCYLNIPDTSSRDSLFQAEARRCLDILDTIETNSDKKHFCIFDELYSGTNPYEAIGSAFSYLDHVSRYSKVKFMLTTHFIRLCSLFQKSPVIKNFNMETTMKNKHPSYSYKLVEGISEIKGGVCVLRQLGYPDELLEKTIEVMKDCGG